MPNHRFGKHPAKHDYRTLRFKTYLKAGIAAPPPSYDVLATVYQKLKTNSPAKLFPMDGNDVYGDCTIAGLAHAETTYNGLVTKHKVMSKNAVEKLYFKLTGGVDSGLAELDVLNYWRQTKVSGDEILAFVASTPRITPISSRPFSCSAGSTSASNASKTARKTSTPASPGRPGRLLTMATPFSLSATIQTWSPC